MKFCPECGKQQEPGARFCAECGYAVGAGSAASSPAAGPAQQAPATEPAEGREFAPAATVSPVQPGQPAQPAQPGQGYGASAQPGQPGEPGQGYGAPGQPAQPGQGSYGYPYQQQRQEQQYPGNSGYGQAQAPSQSGAQRQSAFAGVPVSDYVRDGLAVAALFVSLFMVWTSDPGSYGDPGSYYSEGSKAGTRVDVLLITLVSMLSVGVSYLWRSGVFGPKVGYRKIQDIRLLANLPYFILVLVYFVLSMASESTGERYLGGAVGFGLAGAILAAQPRRGEMAPGDADQSRHRRWLIAVMGLVGLAGVTTLVQIIRFAMFVSGFSGSTNLWPMLATNSLAALLSVGILAAVAVFVFRGSDAWRVAGVSLGIGAAFLAVLEIFGVEAIGFDYFPGTPWFSVLFWVAFGAAVSAPSVARLTQGTVAAPADRLTALRPLLVLTLILASALAAFSLFGLVQTVVDDYDGVATWAVALVLALLLAAGSIAVRKLASRDERSAFVMGSVYAIGLFVVSLVLMILFLVQDFEPGSSQAAPLPVGSAYSLIMVLTWIMPFAVLAVLWLDKATRAHFASLPASGSSGTGFAFEGAPSQTRTTVPGIPTPETLLPGQQHQFPQQAPVQPGQPVQQQVPAEPGQPVQQQVPAEPGQPVQHPAQDQQAAPAAGETQAQEPAQSVNAHGSAPESAHESASAAPGADASGDTGQRPAADPDAALLAEAADPATPLLRLQQLATHPRARVAVAANPSTYPELLGWLSQLGDPAVNDALRRRQ